MYYYSQRNGISSFGQDQASNCPPVVSLENWIDGLYFTDKLYISKPFFPPSYPQSIIFVFFEMKHSLHEWKLRIVCFYVWCVLEEPVLFRYLKKNVLFENLLTILFSDFVSFGFSTTDIVI